MSSHKSLSFTERHIFSCSSWGNRPWSSSEYCWEESCGWHLRHGWTWCSRRHSKVVICSLECPSSGSMLQGKATPSQERAAQWSNVSVLSPSISLKKKNKLPGPWDCVFSPCLQKLGSPSLVKCSQLAPAQGKLRCLLHNSFCLISCDCDQTELFGFFFATYRLNYIQIKTMLKGQLS